MEYSVPSIGAYFFIANCPVLDSPINGSCYPGNCSGYVGETLQFDCQTGYKLNGLQTLTCLQNTTWSGSVPQCRRKLV